MTRSAPREDKKPAKFPAWAAPTLKGKWRPVTLAKWYEALVKAGMIKENGA